MLFEGYVYIYTYIYTYTSIYIYRQVQIQIAHEKQTKEEYNKIQFTSTSWGNEYTYI